MSASTLLRRHESGAKRRPWVAIALAALALSLGVVAYAVMPPARSEYVPHDPTLRQPYLYFFPPHPETGATRSFIFFFGNDVGFWDAHEQLADDLAGQGYAVVGLDLKPLLANLPDGATPASVRARDSAFSARLESVISRSRHELGMDTSRVILVGHSFGAEMAVWTATHVPIRGLVGVVALSTGARGHLRITWRDLGNVGEPHDPGSFSVADDVAALPPQMRVALIRGSHDRLAYADSAIVTEGGNRVRLSMVPFAAHSLKRVILARFVVRNAVRWVLDGSSAPTRRPQVSWGRPHRGAAVLYRVGGSRRRP